MILNLLPYGTSVPTWAVTSSDAMAWLIGSVIAAKIACQAIAHAASRGQRR